MNVDLNALDSSLSVTDFLLNLIPFSVADAFANGGILQVLLFSVLLASRWRNGRKRRVRRGVH